MIEYFQKLTIIWYAIYVIAMYVEFVVRIRTIVLPQHLFISAWI